MVKGLCYKPQGHGFETRGELFIIIILPNPSGSTRLRGFTQYLTEMSARSRKIIFLGSKVRLVRGADNLAAICEPIV
jgi:hypothetical protein